MAMDLLCQEMRDACWVSLESLSSSFHCDHSASEVFVRNRHSINAFILWESFFLQILSLCEDLVPSGVSNSVVSNVPLCSVYSSEGREEA